MNVKPFVLTHRALRVCTFFFPLSVIQIGCFIPTYLQAHRLFLSRIVKGLEFHPPCKLTNFIVAGRRHRKELHYLVYSKQYEYHVCVSFPCPSLATVLRWGGGGSRSVLHLPLVCVIAEEPKLREPKSLIIGSKSACCLFQRCHFYDFGQ